MAPDCGCNTGSKPTHAACPACGGVGQPVGWVTLQSLLRPEARARLGCESYFFCDGAGCETVYFDGRGSSFIKSDLTVRVGLKETTSPRPVCYCFDHSIEEIEDQVRRTGRSTVLDDIKARMQEACWCETRSPQGRCCVGAVRACIERAMKAFGEDSSSASNESRPGDSPSHEPRC